MDLHSLVSEYKRVEREIGKKPTREEFLKNTEVTDWQLRKITFNQVIKAAGDEPKDTRFKAGQDRPVFPEIIRPPKLLYFDFELSHMEVKTYQLKTDYIPHKNIVKHWHFLSYAGVFEHEMDKDFYLDQRYAENKSDDRQLIEGIHALLDSADIWCGHNIKRFDVKKFNTRAALYGLPPIAPKIIWDTLIFFKRHFDLPSYSLAFICKYFNLLEEKLEHSSDMWNRCIAGDMAAWEENELYNKQDNRAARAALKFISKYEPQINLQAFFQRPTCSCGNHSFFKDGHSYKHKGAFQVYRCHDCGKAYVSKQNLIDKDIRKGFFQ